MPGAVIGRLARWLAIVAVLVLALVVADRRGININDLAARLTQAVTPAPAPGLVRESLRADLSGGDPDPDPDYAPTGRFVRQTMSFGGQTRHWWGLAGPAPSGTDLPPAVLLLHGSGRDGAAMLDMWREVAAKGAVLIAPDALDPNGWSVADDGPAFLTAVLKAAGQGQTFDRQRVYLYGHSGGARLALYLAACAPGAWRAVAVHAGTLPECTALARNAAIPVLIQIGDQDRLFNLAAVRQSAATLGQAGHVVDLEVIPKHGHWLYDIGPDLAADAWAFFTRPH